MAKQYKGSTSATSALADIQTVRIPSVGSLLYRGTAASKDQSFINGYFDVLKNQESGKTYFYYTKRPGLSQTNGIQPPAGSAVARGAASFNGKIYSVYGNKIYSNTTDLGVTMTTSTGLVGMTTTRPGATTQYLGINDGVKLFIIATTDVVTTITSNFPTPNTTDLVYMDGYWFTLKTDGTIWNCNADDPTTWDPTMFLTAQMFNGFGVGLAHQNNLMFLFSDRHMQGFYDAANAAGSPLTNYEQAVQQIGCTSQDSINTEENYVTWVGNTNSGGYGVWQINGVSSINQISTPAIDRVLNAEGSNITSCYSYSFRKGGRFFYCLNLTGSNRTFVYDNINQLWTEFQVAGGTTAWPIVNMFQHNNKLMAQHATNGWIYHCDPSIFQDDSINFTVLQRLARVDLDTNRRKYMRRFELIGDIQPSSCPVLLQYSDDDYNTLSTARTLDMSLTRNFAYQLGSFRRRSWQLSHTANTALRIEAMEMEVRLGDS